MSGWDLAWPWALLLLPLPLLAMRFLPRQREGGGALRVPASIATPFETSGAGTSAGSDRRWLPWLIWITLVFALSGPRLVVGAPAQPATGRAIMLALDLSGSMERNDFEIDSKPASRLAVLKKIGVDFIRRRKGDRVGLVIFAEEAYAVSPLSFDTAAVATLLQDSTIGLVGRSTAIGDGLGLALKRLTGTEAKSKIIVLLSDGANNTGSTSPLEVAKLAKALNIRIHTIALGINDIGSEDPDAVDAPTLKQVSEISGGTPFRVHTTAELAAASRAIDLLESDKALAPPRIVRKEYWPFPATLALMLAGLAMAGGRLRR